MDDIIENIQEKYPCGIKKTPTSEPCNGSISFSVEDGVWGCDTCDFCVNDNQGN